MTTTEKAVGFLKMVVSGKIREAYAEFVAPTFIHHNPWFKGDAHSLMIGMIENHNKFPEKKFEIQRTISEGNLVMTHSKVIHAPDKPFIAVVHIFRFENGKIAELWDLGQPTPENSPNQFGIL